MSLSDLLKRRKNIVFQESKGLDLAIYTINEFEDRRFSFRGLRCKHSGVNGEELLKLLQKEIDSTLIVYRYMTKVKKYMDQKGTPQIQIKIIGKASMMSRYNLLDIKLKIITDFQGR